jgi:hypothetical protein
VKLLEPKINKDGMKKWSFTCSACHWIPDKQWIATDLEDKNEWLGEWTWPDPDYATTHRISKRTGMFGKRALHMPDRCNACKAKYRRSTRMKKRIKRIMEICEELPTGYKVPKLLTFALPVSTSDFYSDRNVLIAELNQLLPAARRILKKNHIIGGTFVIECTSRLMPMDDGGSVFQWKHHPHVHMVCIGKYQKDIQTFSKCLMPIGLGRINYEATKSKRKIGNYLSKYLIKDNQRSRTWGVLYRSKLNSFLINNPVIPC